MYDIYKVPAVCGHSHMWVNRMSPRSLILQLIHLWALLVFAPMTVQPPNSILLQDWSQRIHEHKNVGTQFRCHWIFCRGDGRMSISCTCCYKQLKIYIRHFCSPPKFMLVTLWYVGVLLPLSCWPFLSLSLGFFPVNFTLLILYQPTLTTHITHYKSNVSQQPSPRPHTPFFLS